MLGTIASVIGALIAGLAFYLDHIRDKISPFRRNATILLVWESRDYRENIAELLKKNNYRVIEVETTHNAKQSLEKKSIGILITHPGTLDRGNVDGIELCSHLNIIKRNIYTIFISTDTDIKSVYNNLTQKIAHPFFEVLSMSEPDPNFSELIIEKVRQCHKTKNPRRKLIKRWNKLEEIEDVTVMYITIGDFGAQIHKFRKDQILRRKHAWYMDRCFGRMTSIAEGYKGVVYPNIDEGITVVFLPSKCRDTLNIAIQAAKEILTEIKVLASKHHFADICNLRIGIATERVTSATLEAGGNSTYDVFGIAVGYAKSLALYDKVEKNSILIYKPPLDEGSRQHLKEVHGIKEESVSKTSRRIRSVITGIEFYKI